MPRQLLLIRGLPGSGKSTLASKIAELPNWHHVETDMFFTDGHGRYHFIRSYIQIAHEWCRNETTKALANGQNVVVANTFCEEWEMAPYRSMGANLNIITMTSDYGNVHDVPLDVIDRMRQRFISIHS